MVYQVLSDLTKEIKCLYIKINFVSAEMPPKHKANLSEDEESEDSLIAEINRREN
jgi:hypothetical protein